MKRLALLGASGHGKVVADTALAAGWDEVFFFDDAWPGLSKNGPWQIVGDSADLMARHHEYQGVLVSIGDSGVRWAKHQALHAVGARLVTVIHPAATVSRYSTLGFGSVVMAGAVINADTHIGQAGIVNTGATVDHDCDLADGVHVCPGTHIAGNVHVGLCAVVGIGAAIKQGLSIGSHSVVGAGAVVIHSVDGSSVVVGNPARKLR